MTLQLERPPEVELTVTHVVSMLTLHRSRNMWLVCTCRWKARVGINPTVERILQVTNDHLQGAKA